MDRKEVAAVARRHVEAVAVGVLERMQRLARQARRESVVCEAHGDLPRAIEAAIVRVDGVRACIAAIGGVLHEATAAAAATLAIDAPAPVQAAGRRAANEAVLDLDARGQRALDEAEGARERLVDALRSLREADLARQRAAAAVVMVDGSNAELARDLARRLAVEPPAHELSD